MLDQKEKWMKKEMRTLSPEKKPQSPQINFSLKKYPDKLGEKKKNLSDEKFLTLLSIVNLFHEAWPREVWLQSKLHKAEISRSGKIKFWVKEWLEPQVVLYLIQMLCLALCLYNMSAFLDWRNSHCNRLT